MAESDHRLYRDFATERGPEKPPAQADDPLAELARLIGQSVPMNRSSQDRRPPARETYPAPDEVLHEPSDEQYLAADEGRYDQDFEQGYDTADDGRYEPSIRANPPPPVRSARFDDEPDFASAAASETPYELHDSVRGESDEVAYREPAEASSDAFGSHYRYDEDDSEAHDHSDDHAYGEDEEYGEGLNTPRRSGFIFVAAIFGLAVLGTAGAFAYHAMFGGPMLPTLPPIIKAEGGPNKIKPGDSNSQASASAQAGANNADFNERLVSREERPVEVPPPVNTAPRPVSTVPVFPDPPAAGGFPTPPAPSSTLGSTTQPPIAARADIPNAPATAVTSTVNPAPSSASASVASPPGPMATPPVPGAPGPKKIHTVPIHTDQSSAADAAVGSVSNQAAPARSATQSQGAKPGAGDANGPLSIVPSSTESSPATARPRTVPAQPVPLNKPPANETASAAPVAPSGGYAVQVSSHRSEEEAQSSFRDLQAKYPDLLGGRTPLIRRADLGAKGIYYRAMVGPFTSADRATELCSNLKAAGGSCLVQKN